MTFPSALASVPPPTGGPILKCWDDGQSNSEGQGSTIPQRVSGSYSLIRRLEEIQRTPGMWGKAGGNCRDQAVPAGNEGVLGTMIQKHGAQAAFAAAAVAASRIPVNVTTGRSGTDITAWGSGGTCRALFDATWTEVSVFCTSANWVYIWSQGESDSQTSPLSSNYETRFGDWIDHVRSVLPSCYVIARLMPSGLTGSFKAAVNTAISNVITAKGNGQTLNTDSYGYATPHWTSAGLAAMGADEYTIAAAHV